MPRRVERGGHAYETNVLDKNRPMGLFTKGNRPGERLNHRLATVRRRLHEQRLAGERFDTPAEAVARLGAVQAQEYAEAKWSLAERVADCADADVEEAFTRGEILRTHVMRPTWHFVAAADIRWMLRLTSPRVHAASRYWYKQAGIDEDTVARCHEILEDALGPGEPLIRKELAARLSEGGVASPEGLRLGYILMHAELQGLVCSGPRRGKQQSYVLLEQRVPEARGPDGGAALAELTRRYFLSHGPATVKDFGWWSGLTVAQVREGLELVGDELAGETDQAGTSWYSAPSAAPDSGPTRGHLIPMYDELGVAYKDLRMVLREQPPGEGMLRRAILIDGECVGSWSRTLAARDVTVEATLFTALNKAETAALDAVVERFGASLGLEARLSTTRAG